MGDWTWTGSSFSNWFSAQLVSEPSACAWPCSVDADTPLGHTHSKKSLWFEQLDYDLIIWCDSTATQPLLIDLVYLGLTGCWLASCCLPVHVCWSTDQYYNWGLNLASDCAWRWLFNFEFKWHQWFEAVVSWGIHVWLTPLTLGPSLTWVTWVAILVHAERFVFV